MIRQHLKVVEKCRRQSENNIEQAVGKEDKTNMLNQEQSIKKDMLKKLLSQVTLIEKRKYILKRAKCLNLPL